MHIAVCCLSAAPSLNVFTPQAVTLRTQLAVSLRDEVSTVALFRFVSSGMRRRVVWWAVLVAARLSSGVKLLDSEYKGTTVFRNVGSYSPNDMASRAGRQITLLDAHQLYRDRQEGKAYAASERKLVWREKYRSLHNNWQHAAESAEGLASYLTVQSHVITRTAETSRAGCALGHFVFPVLRWLPVLRSAHMWAM